LKIDFDNDCGGVADGSFTEERIMSLRIIQDHELTNDFSERLVLVDMGEPGLYAISRDPAFLIGQVEHEYVCFDARRGEVVKLDDAALDHLKSLA
jgi:hypothetical protein